MAALPKADSSYGRVELAFVNGKNMMPVGLGPCSRCVDIQRRHQDGDRCWGTFPTQWHLQGDTSLQCVQSSYHVPRLEGYYTTPQSNHVYSQDVQDDDKSVARAQAGIYDSLQWPVGPGNDSVNVAAQEGASDAAWMSIFSGRQEQHQQEYYDGSSSSGYVATAPYGNSGSSSSSNVLVTGGLSSFMRPFF